MSTFFILYAGHEPGWPDWAAGRVRAAGHTVILEPWDGPRLMERFKHAPDVVKALKHDQVVLCDGKLDNIVPVPHMAAAFAGEPAGTQHVLTPVSSRATIYDTKQELKALVYAELNGRTIGDLAGEFSKGINGS